MSAFGIGFLSRNVGNTIQSIARATGKIKPPPPSKILGPAKPPPNVLKQSKRDAECTFFKGRKVSIQGKVGYEYIFKNHGDGEPYMTYRTDAKGHITSRFSTTEGYAQDFDEDHDVYSAKPTGAFTGNAQDKFDNAHPGVPWY